MSRKITYDARVADRVLELVAAGSNLSSACRAAGVARSTFKGWIDADFGGLAARFQTKARKVITPAPVAPIASEPAENQRVASPVARPVSAAAPPPIPNPTPIAGPAPQPIRTASTVDINMQWEIGPRLSATIVAVAQEYNRAHKRA